MPLVTRKGFAPTSTPATSDGELEGVLDLTPDVDAEPLRERFDEIDMIRIAFPSFSDGRGFSLAQRLRNLGYKGHLRACGHIISDQFRYALACGFNDVEISEELAARQPEADWLVPADGAQTYRDRLAGNVTQAAVRVSPYVSNPSIYELRVTQVQHYSDDLFSFRLTRPAGFRFRSGEFAMIGLPNAAKPVFRAYSLASATWDDEIEFYSIKVPNGPLTEHLKNISVGDTVLLKKKATGTLVIDALLPGRRLFLFSTGTGIAPFASIIRDPETYEKFMQVIVTHTCRWPSEIAYSTELLSRTQQDPIVGELATNGRLRLITSLTRSPHTLEGRITELVQSGRLFDQTKIDRLDGDNDRVMICGSIGVLRDMREICEAHCFCEGSNARPGTFVVERAFAE